MSELGKAWALVKRTSNVIADNPLKSTGLSANVRMRTPPCC